MADTAEPKQLTVAMCLPHRSCPERLMQTPVDIYTYMQLHSAELGKRILSSYPALHGVDEAPSPLLSQMLRLPYPAQTLAIMGVSKRWLLARNANVVAECGSGKTLIAEREHGVEVK